MICRIRPLFRHRIFSLLICESVRYLCSDYISVVVFQFALSRLISRYCIFFHTVLVFASVFLILRQIRVFMLPVVSWIQRHFSSVCFSILLQLDYYWGWMVLRIWPCFFYYIAGRTTIIRIRKLTCWRIYSWNISVYMFLCWVLITLAIFIVFRQVCECICPLTSSNIRFYGYLINRYPILDKFYLYGSWKLTVVDRLSVAVFPYLLAGEVCSSGLEAVCDVVAIVFCFIWWSRCQFLFHGVCIYIAVCIGLRQILVFVCPGVAVRCPSRSHTCHFCFLFTFDISVKFQRYAVRSCIVSIAVIHPCLCNGDVSFRTYLDNRFRIFICVVFFFISIF